jgi:hypothetical protein
MSGPIGEVLGATAGEGRQLDRDNPSPGSLGKDFLLVGLHLTNAVRAHARCGGPRLQKLDAAVHLRNGTAHDDESKIALARSCGAVPTFEASGDTERPLAASLWTLTWSWRNNLSRLGNGHLPW